MRKIALALGAVAALVLLQVYLRTPMESLFWASLMNAGHAPLFGCIALLFLAMARAWAPLRGLAPPHLALVVFAGAVGLGASTEVWQHFAGRDAALEDFGRDVAGSAAFLLFAFAREGRARKRLVLRALGCLLLVIALARITTVSVAYVGRETAFPRIAGFDARWETLFVEARDARLERVPPPSGWGGERRGKVGRVTFLPRHLPALVLREPHPDWRGREALAFTLHSEESRPVQVTLRVHDLEHRSRHPERFERSLLVPPGTSEVRIPLAELRDQARGGPMDMAGIRYIVLYARDPREAFTLYLDEIRLD